MTTLSCLPAAVRLRNPRPLRCIVHAGLQTAMSEGWEGALLSLQIHIVCRAAVTVAVGGVLLCCRGCPQVYPARKSTW